MSRRSYKWDIIHVQRGAVACGDQEAGLRGAHGRTQLYSKTGRGQYYFFPYGTPIQDSAWSHRPERVDHGRTFE